MKKRMLSILLSLVMCVSMLPMQVFAAQDDSVTVTLDPETVVFSPAETSAQAMSLLTLDDAGKVSLKATNEVEWIDRLDLTGAIDTTAFEEFDNNYALGFYHYLESSTHQGGDLRSAWASEYSAVTFTGKGEFAYTGDKAVDSEAAYAAIADELAANRNEASAYLSAAYYAFDRDHPEVFWLSGESMLRWYEGYSYSSDGTVTYEQTISFVLRDEEKGFDIRDGRYLDESLNLDEEWINDIDAESQAIATELSMIVRNIAQVDSRESALRELHDYLTTSNEYNTSDDLSSADSICWEYVTAIVGSEGTKGPVCEAYARAFKVVCDKAGIPCVLVDGFASPDGVDGEAHMWNYVQMEDGLWYAVDVTWDDPVVAGVSGAKSGYEHEDYFLVGAQTEIDGVTFEVSHPVSNAPSSSAPNFTNGPVLSDDAYVASEGGDTGDTGDSKEPRLMAYRVEGDGAGGWVDPGYGMEDAWYFNGTYLCTQAVFCFGTEDDYIELDMDNLWVSDEKAVELIYEGTNTAGSDVMTLNVYEFGNHTIYYEDDTGVVHKMPVYVYLPDVGYFSEPVMSEETYLHQFVLTETNRTYYVVSGVGDIISVELSEDDTDLAEYLQIEWEGNYASITVTENPPYTWMYPYLYVTIDRGEDYPDGWWAGMGLDVLVDESGEGGGEVPEVPVEPEYPSDSGMCGDDVYWTLENGVLTIYGSGAIQDCSGYTAPWSNYYPYIKDAIVQEGVTAIGPWAFAYCDQMGSVSLPQSLQVIDYGAFVLCSALTEVTIPAGVTLVNSQAFTNCTALREITFLGDAPQFNEEMYSGEDAFTNVTATVYYPAGNPTWTAAVMKNYGGSLTWVAMGGGSSGPDIPEGPVEIASGRIGDNVYWTLTDDGMLRVTGTGAMWDTIPAFWEKPYGADIVHIMIEEGITHIGDYGFYQLPNLTGVSMPESVTSIGDSAFYYCEALSTVAMGMNVTSIGDEAFYKCTSLTAIPLSAELKSIGDWAFTSSGLTALPLPEGLESIGDQAFQNCVSLMSVYIPGSVKTVGKDAFYHCDSLMTVTFGAPAAAVLPETGKTEEGAETSGVSVGRMAFSWCKELNSVMFMGDVSALGESAFYQCEKLMNVNFQGNVDSIGEYAFEYCYALEMVNFMGDAPGFVGDWAFSGVTAICYYPADKDGWDAFMERRDTNFGGTLTWVPVGEVMPGIVDSGVCGDDLTWTVVEITDEDVGSYYVLTISGTGAMYDYEIEEPGWYIHRGQTLKVVLPEGMTTIGKSAFYDFGALVEVDIPDSVTTIGMNAFNSCSALETLDLGSGVESIGTNAFKLCTALNELVIPDSVTQIWDSAFESCTALESVALGSGVYSIDNFAFMYCENLTGIVIPNNVLIIGASAFGYCYGLESVDLGSGVEIIVDGAFSHTALTEVIIPGSVNDLGNWAFWSCTGLTKVTFEGNAPAIGEDAFCDVVATCYYPAGNDTWTEFLQQEDTNFGGTLTWVPVGEVMPGAIASGECGDNLNWELTDDGVLTITGTGAMYDYDARQDTTLPGWHEYAGRITTVCLSKEQTTIGENAFIDLTALTAITVPDSVESIGYQAFWGCKALKNISFGSGLKSIGEYVFMYCYALEKLEFGSALESIGEFAFSECTGLKEIFIPDSVTALGKGAFSNCTALTKVQLGSGVKTLDHFTFRDCSALKEVVGLEHVTAINNYVFAGTALTEIIIPASVQTIGNWTFQSCESLTKVTFEGDAPSIGDYAFQNVTATCYYPADNTTWTEAVMENYGGTLTWKAMGGETETGCLLTFNFPADLCDVYATVANTTEPVYRSGDRVEAGTYLAYTITDIADGYRIKSVVMNGIDRTQGFVNGAYGGMATTIKDDVTVDVELEPIPEVLPSVDSVTLYMDPAFAELAADNVTVDGNTRFYGKATYSDGVDYPIYYIGGVWEYSTDGINWKQDLAWGSNRFDYWPGWTSRENFDPAAGDFFVTGSYDLRLRVEPKDLYSTGAEVLSNVIHVNGGAAGGEEPEVPNDLAVTDLHFDYLGSGPLPYLYWTGPTDVSGDLRYNVYVSADEGRSWTMVSSTSQELISLTGLDAAVYNAFKVETEVDDVVVAGATAKLTLAVTQGKDLPAATVVITEPEVEGEDYDIVVSGLTPRTWIRFTLKRSSGGSNSNGSTSDASGIYTSRKNWSTMSKYLADAASTYLVQEYSDGSISEDSLSAAYTFNNRGGWTLLSNAMGGGNDGPEVPESGYGIEVWLDGASLIATITGPADASKEPIYSYYFYNTEDPSVYDGLGGMPIGAWQPFDFRPGTYNAWQVLRTEDGTVLGEGMLAKPIVSVADAFEHPAVTLTKGEYSDDHGGYAYILTGLDLETYTYTLETETSGYYIYDTTIYTDEHAFDNGGVLYAQLNSECDDCFMQELSCGLQVTLSGGNTGETDENRLMFRDLYWNEGVLVESEWLFTGWNPSVLDNMRVRFYFGTEDSYVAVDPGRLSVSGKGIYLECEYTEDGAVDYVWIHTIAFGDYQVIYTHTDGKEYSIPVTVGLPEVGFYSQPVASEENYLWEQFTVTEENNTFYFVPRDGKLTRVELDERFAGIATAEIAEGGYAVITVTAVPDGDWYHLNYDFEDAYGNSYTNWGRGLNIKSGIPHLMYRGYYWNENDELVEDKWFQSEYHATIQSGMRARFYFGTEDSYVAVDPDSLTVSGDGIELQWVYNEDGLVDHVIIHAVDFGDYEVIYTTDNAKYTLPVTVGLPEIGFYSESVASEKSYLYEAFTVTAENNTFYLVPINGALTNVELLDELAKIATVAMGENGSYAAITVNGTPNGRWYNMRVEFMNSYGDSRARNVGLELKDGTPHLMLRHLNWKEDGVQVENADFWTNWNTAINSGLYARFYFGTEDNYVAVDPASLSISGDGITLKVVYTDDGAVDYVFIETVAFGEYQVIYTDADGAKYTLPVSVGLPPLGFYTESVASEKAYIDEFTVTEENNTIYLIPHGFKLISVKLNEDFAKIATVTMAEDGSYATVAITGTPGGYWYRLNAVVEEADGTRRDWGAGLQLIDGNPHLMFRGMDVDENGVWYENPNAAMEYQWKSGIGYGRVVKFYFGTPDSYVPVDVKDLTATAGVKLSVEQGQFVWMDAVAFGKQEIVYTDANGEKYSLPVVVSLPDLAFYNKPVASEENYIDEFKVTAENDTVYLVALNGKLTKVELVFDFAKIAEVEIAEDGSYAAITVTGTPNGNPYMAIASVETENGNVWSMYAHLRIIDGNPRLMFRDMDRDENGWYENPDWIMRDSMVISLDSASVCKFYFGTEGDCVAVDPDSLTASGDGIVLQWVYNNDGSVYYALVLGRAFGEYQIIYTDADGEKYTLPVKVSLPPLGFYTEPVASEAAYIEEFTVTDENDTFYLIAPGNMLTRVELSSSLAKIATVEIAEDGSYAAITVTGTPTVSWYGLTADFGNEYWSTTGIGAGLYITDGRTEEPEIDYAVTDLRFEEKNGMPYLYWTAPAGLDQDVRYVVMLSMSVGSVNQWLHLNSTDETSMDLTGTPSGSYTAVKVVTKSGGTALGETLAESVADLALTVTEGENLAPAAVVITPPKAEDGDYAISISGVTPNTFFLFGMRNTDGIRYEGLVSDADGACVYYVSCEQMQAYLMETDSAYQVKEFSGSVSEDGASAEFTRSIRGDWFSIADAVAGGVNRGALMFREADWTPETGWFDNSDMVMSTEWNCQIRSAIIGKFFFVTDTESVELTIDQLTVSGNGVELGESFGFINMASNNDGRYTVRYTHTDGVTYNFPVNVTLPNVAFYTQPVADGDYYVNVFKVTEMGQMLCLMPSNGYTLFDISVSPELAAIARFEFDGNRNYVIMVITGVPADRWYDIGVSYGNDAEYHTETVSIRLLNGMTQEDTQAPFVDLAAPDSVYGGSKYTPPLTIGASDDVDLAKIVLSYTVDGENCVIEELAVNGTRVGMVYDWSVEGLPSGLYTVAAVAYDAAGNESEPAAITITIDNDPPAVTEHVTAEGDFEKIVLNWTADTTGDVSLYRIERDGVEISVVSAGVSSYADYTAEPGAEHSYCVVAEDELGNRAASAAVKAQRTADEQAPVILDIWPTTEDNVTFCYNGTVSLKLSDNWKLAKLEAFCGDELVYAAKMDYADGYVEFTWDVSKLNGEQTLDIKVTDAAGNVTERSVTVTVRPYSAPMIPGNLTAVAGFKTASLKWTYSGDLKTLKQFKVYSCDADGANLVLVNNVKNYKYTVRNLAQGTHYFVVAAEDIYGNLSGFARVEVYLANEDSEAPVAVILPKDPMGVEGIAIDFSGVNSTDNDEIASYSWNFGDGTTGTGVNCSHAYSQPGSYTVTLTVTDRSGNKTTAQKEVNVLDVTGADATHSIVTVTVMDGYVEGTPAIANATVTIYDEAGFEITALTDANGKAELVVPNGVCNMAAAASGYTASGRKIVVQGNETGRMDCTVYLAGSSVKTVDGSLTTHVMTYEEIVAAGIDTTDPANNHVVKHAFVLEFKPTPELAFEIPVVNYTNRNGDRVGIENQIIWYEFEVEDDDEDPGDGASPDWDHSIPMKVGVFPITEHFYLVIYGETHWLKEMFNVELLVINNSYAENITDCIAELELPEGLSLASMLVGGQSPVVSLGDIGHVGNTDGLPNQVSTNWYVRGDKEGEYTLTANVTGNFTQDLYNKTPFSTSFTTPAPIQVYAGSALKLFITAQDTAYYNTEYYVQFKLQNVSDRTLYNVSFGLTGAEQYRAEIQHRGKEGDVIKELDKLSEEHFGDAFYTVEEFRPGDAITVNFCTKTLFLSEEWEAFADKLEFINIAYKLQNVFVMTLEGSTTEIPYEVEILPVAKQSFAEWLWDQAKENVGDAIKDGAVNLIDAAFFGGIPVTENVVKVFEYAMDEYEKATNTADSYMTITLERGAYFDDGSSTWSGRSAQEGVRVYTDGKYEVAEDGSIRLYGNGKLYVERTGATVDENGSEIEPQINVTTHYVDGLGVTQEYTYSLVEEDGKSFVADEDDLQLVVEEVYMEPPVGPGVTYKEEDGEPVISVEKPSSDELERVITFPFVLLNKTGNLVTDGSNVLWQLIDALGNLNPEGLYLDQNGNLTIGTDAKPGDYTVTLSLIQPLEGQRIIPGGAMLMSTGDEDEPVTSVSYTFTLEPAPVVVDLTAMEVSFDAEILMWTYFIIPDELLNDDGAKVLVTKNGAWGKKTTEITMAELRAAGPTAYGDYRIEQGIASGEMTREVTVQIMDGDGNYVSIRDYVSGNVDTKVVRTAADYAARVFEVGSAKQKELVKAMLTYGGYSQKHFNVDAGNPVYNLLTEYGYEIPALGDITAADIAQEMTKSAVSNGMTYSAQEAYLDSAIYHRVYFKLAAGEEVSNFRFEIELIDVYGKLYTETVTATYDSVYDEYYVDIPEIAAAHLDHLYTITVTNLTTGDTYEVTTSVLVWAKTVIARSYNVNQVNLAKAVYYYNQAANVFFGK